MIGYDKHVLGHQKVLDLTFEEEVGVLAYCRAQSDIVATLHGVPTWQQFINGLQYLDFDATNPDWLDAPAADTTALDFTSENFSLANWIRFDDLSGWTRLIFCRGLLSTDGWSFAVLSNGSLSFVTNQAAATQITYSIPGQIATAIWYLVGVSRIGASIRIYKNGVDISDTLGVHIDPLTSARELHIGVYDNEVDGPFDGGMHRPRAWNRALTPLEHRTLYLSEYALFP